MALLEDAIEKHRSAVALLNFFNSPLHEKQREDDISVRPYIVRRYYRRRPHKSGKVRKAW